MISGSEFDGPHDHILLSAYSGSLLTTASVVHTKTGVTQTDPQTHRFHTSPTIYKPTLLTILLLHEFLAAEICSPSRCVAMIG